MAATVYEQCEGMRGRSGRGPPGAVTGPLGIHLRNGIRVQNAFEGSEPR